jgi:PhzF family phenazine biosynthesis protein
MPLPLFHVDAFTDRPFTGNPAAVCLLADWPPIRWLQGVAQEMNLSETAFLVKRDDRFDLRWFTPRVEVDLCGHATLASAHVIRELGLNAGASVRFDTRSGILTATYRDGAIELDFPRTPSTPAETPPGLLEALGVAAKHIGRSRFDYLVEVDSEAVLRRMTPDFKSLAALPVRGIMVTCRADDPRFDFMSRFFAPAAGVDEDPVTGSAHCCLADYWNERLGKTSMTAYQASQRGGVVQVRVAGDRVILGGNAVTIARGQLAIDVDSSGDR